VRQQVLADAYMTVSYLYKDDNKSSNITPSCKSTIS
jgi:hypothetical protein